jgi:hypothetical protein
MTPESAQSQTSKKRGGMRQYGGAKPNAEEPQKEADAARRSDGDDSVEIAPPVRNGLVLARASELPQPEKDQHFLRMFGQSDRQIADSSSDEGSIPQVLMLMNGEAQKVIGQSDSLVIQTATGQWPHPSSRSRAFT